MSIPTWIAWLCAFASTAGLTALWLRDARDVLTERKSTLESAASQLTVCRRRAEERQDRESAVVLDISKSIYAQALEHYNEARSTWWLYIPARLLGFGPAPREDG